MDERFAEAHVELAILSALAFGRDDVELEVVLPAFAAIAIDRWIRRAAVVTTLEAVFEDG